MTTNTPAKTAATTVTKTVTKAATKTVAKPVTKAAAQVVAKATPKEVQKLQRAVVDGLEDVKAQDIVVFDTEHLSSLFERVIVASGTSNRQTKALAASVVDAVREAGFPKPRVEGEANGEWIIVDCGAAVVHVMQPNIRTYYNLEELWGEKPVRLKLGAAKPVVAAAAAPAKPTVAARDAASLRRSSAAKKGVEEAFPSKAQMQKAADIKAAAAKKAATKSVAKPRSTAAGAAPVAKPRIKTLVVNAPAKPAAKKVAAKKPAVKSAPARKTPARKV
jgi:ribosome-associated protein